jgi:hypothetical protein
MQRRAKIALLLASVPMAVWGRNGLLGVFSPRYADNNVYLAYVEPGDYGGGLYHLTPQ